MIGLHLYDGAFKVIPMDAAKGTLREAFNVRLDEPQVRVRDSKLPPRKPV